MAKDELDIVAWLARRQRRHEAVRLGIGDDMAVLRLTGQSVLITADMLLDGVHFDSAKHEPAMIGRKAIACSLSDCAAMAVKPLAATVSLALPSGSERTALHSEGSWPVARVEAMMEGMFRLAELYNMAIAGGDTNRWPGALAIDVAIVAEPYPDLEPILRSGAQVGDAIYVTGRLGGSIQGRHLTFEPRVEEARKLRAALGDRLHAMMDLSDGLSLDLWRMCQDSGVGAMLDEDQLDLVISDDARQQADDDGQSPLEHALTDGEDFELLLAVGGSADASIIDLPLTRIGIITEADFSIRRADGRIELLEPKGFVH